MRPSFTVWNFLLVVSHRHSQLRILQCFRPGMLNSAYEPRKVVMVMRNVGHSWRKLIPTPMPNTCLGSLWGHLRLTGGHSAVPTRVPPPPKRSSLSNYDIVIGTCGFSIAAARRREGTEVMGEMHARCWMNEIHSFVDCGGSFPDSLLLYHNWHLCY